MKITAGILGFIVGLLIIQPLFAEFGLPSAYGDCSITETKTECPSKKSCKAPGSSKNQNDCETKGCNPLLGCSSGNFYVHSFSTVTFEHFILLKARTALVNDNRTRKQSNECWHPPELV